MYPGSGVCTANPILVCSMLSSSPGPHCCFLSSWQEEEGGADNVVTRNPSPPHSSPHRPGGRHQSTGWQGAETRIQHSSQTCCCLKQEQVCEGYWSQLLDSWWACGGCCEAGQARFPNHQVVIIVLSSHQLDGKQQWWLGLELSMECVRPKFLSQARPVRTTWFICTLSCLSLLIPVVFVILAISVSNPSPSSFLPSWDRTGHHFPTTTLQDGTRLLTAQGQLWPSCCWEN